LSTAFSRRERRTAATIPLCLWDYESRLKAGDRLILAAFGGGFTWGGAYLTWAYDGSKRTSRGDRQMPKRNDSL
jgi:3-Oxoacyl-[acyl-carrier-protein (ACP)] synthase III C terminal